MRNRRGGIPDSGVKMVNAADRPEVRGELGMRAELTFIVERVESFERMFRLHSADHRQAIKDLDRIRK